MIEKLLLDMIYSYSGILFNNKVERDVDTYYNLGESQKHYAESKRPDVRGQLLSDSIYIIFPDSANAQRQNTIPVCQRLEERESGP